MFFFFFNDTATTEIYTLSLHDALPIFMPQGQRRSKPPIKEDCKLRTNEAGLMAHADLNSSNTVRSEEHTSELQSRQYLVCRLLLEKKKQKQYTTTLMCQGE